MAIAQFKYIESIGRFRKAASQGDVTLKKFTLIFGENGRGKSTICAILRSLQRQSPDILEGRKTLGATASPNVIIALTNGQASFNGAWRSPDLLLNIFDSQYVSENVYSGDIIGTQQRRNLCRVVLGSEGVEYAKRYDDIDESITALNRDLQETRTAILTHTTMRDLSDFLQLANDPEIDGKIEAKTRDVEGLREIDRLRDRTGLTEIQIPPLPKILEDILSKSLDDISKDAELAVKKHIAQHDLKGGAEDWLAIGVTHLKDDDCPFCGQSIDGLSIISSFKDYFNAEYRAFRSEIERYKVNAARLFASDRIELLQNQVAGNADASDFWLRYVAMAKPDPELLGQLQAVLSDFGKEVLSLLDLKLSSPIDKVELTQTYLEARERFIALTTETALYNGQISAANGAIEKFKRNATASRLQSATNELAVLQLVKKRHDPAVSEICEHYAQLGEEKRQREKAKENARGALNTYAQEVMTRYQDSVNDYLRTFTAGFRIGRCKVEYTGRIPNYNFCIVINDTMVDAGNDDTPINEPSFKNTLSAGDRSTLALAYFLTELKEDKNKADCVVVFDDPFNSQDQFRRTCTMTEIRRCGEFVAQIVVLSHDRNFLKGIWDLPLPPDKRKALRLLASGVRDTVIGEWDIEGDTETEDAGFRRALIDFYQTREGSPRDIVQKLRPVAETHMRRLAPVQLENIKGLGSMIEKIRQEAQPASLIDALDELENLNYFTRRYMHGENPHHATEPLSADELHGFVGKTLEVVGAH